MITKFFSTILLVTCSLYFVCAQDLHFTNFDFAPLYLNPAQTGSYKGSVRVNGIAREQFASFINDPYQTVMVSADGNLSFAARDQDWSGVGLTVFRDQVGEISLRTSGMLMSYAYHFALDKKQKSILTASIQQGLFQKSIENNWRPEDQILSSSSSTGDKNLFDEFNGSSGNSTNAGLQYRSQVNKKTFFAVGLSMYSIIQPRRNAMDMNQPARRTTMHGNLINQISKKLSLEYALFYSRAAKVNNTMLQLRTHIDLSKIKKEKGKKTTIERGQLMLGLGYRVNDAMQLLTAYVYDDWHIGFAYDLTVSSASQFSNSNGAFEIGLKRIFNIYKKPEVQPAILCPRF